MDENEIEEIDYPHAKTHNRWTVLVLSLNYISRVIEQTGQFTSELTIAAAQHANQKMIDKKFNEIVS